MFFLVALVPATGPSVAEGLIVNLAFAFAFHEWFEVCVGVSGSTESDSRARGRKRKVFKYSRTQSFTKGSITPTERKFCASQINDSVASGSSRWI